MRVSCPAALLSLLAVAASCTRANSDYCDADEDCGGGLICDRDGQIEGRANACIALDCQPGELLACEPGGDSALLCDDSGTAAAEQDCEFGCSDGVCRQCEPGSDAVCSELGGGAGEVIRCDADGRIVERRECVLGCRSDAPACVDIAPANGLGDDLDFIDANPDAAPDLVLGDGSVVSDEGIVDKDGNAVDGVSSRSIAPKDGVPVVIYRVASLTIQGEVSFEGSSAVAFVSDGDIVIDGVVRVRGGRIAVDPCTGDDGSESGADESGAGGGSFGTSGGDGGDVFGVVGGGKAGSTHGSEDLVPLRAGCDGGGRNNSFGRGGGATQLVSRTRIRLLPGAAIDAGGGGGGFDSVSLGSDAKAIGGGGSGGGVLLEAPILELGDGSFVGANGGGGGCEGALGEPSVAAEPGALSAQPADGASCSGGTGDGGSGGTGRDPDQDGRTGDSVSGTVGPDAAGGGGGGAGRIRIDTALGSPPKTQFSPAPSMGLLETR